MLLFGNKLELLNTIMILILIIVLLFCYVGNYFNYVEKFSQSQYGYVACPPQFTKKEKDGKVNIYWEQGTLGIGTNDPHTSYKLDVRGLSRVVGEFQVSGPNLTTHICHSSGHTYIRCGKTNHKVLINDTGGVTEIGKTGSGVACLVNGELQIRGAHRMSHICHSSGHTYIRGGNNGGQVILNDYGGGRVYCGSNLHTVGDIFTDSNFRIKGNTIQMSQGSYHNTHFGLGASKWHHAGDYASFTTGYDNGNDINTMWMNIKNGSSYIKMYYKNRIVASTWVSDERVKTNIVKVNDNMQYMNYLRKCNMYKYNFKEKLEKCPEDIPDDGLIAQELEKIIPKSVDKAVGTIKDIDTKCTIVNDILELDINGKINCDIKENDVLELTDECLQNVKLKIKSIIDNNKYSIELCENEKIDYNKKYNVTGYVVDDLRHLDYNLLNRISIGAIKYLDNEVIKLKEIIEKQQKQIELLLNK